VNNIIWQQSMSRNGFVHVQGDENKLSRSSQLNTDDYKGLEKECRFGNQLHNEEQENHDLIDDTKVFPFSN
jgi:hypothetical protein